MSKLVEGSGPLDADIWVIGEAPGEHEVEQGLPFVGASGKELKRALEYSGVDVESLRFENLIGIRPPGNKFTYFESTETLQVQLEDSVCSLRERIHDMKPNLLLLMGAMPLKYLTGNTGISAWRGHLQWIGGLDCKALATYHPSAWMRQRRVGKENNPGQYEALARADLMKAVKEGKTHDLHYAPYETITSPTFSDVESYIKLAHSSGKILSFDIETSGRGNSVIDCIGFATSNDLAICIPFYSYTGTKKEPELVPYWMCDEVTLAVWHMVKELLESDIPKVAQNSQFDTIMLRVIMGIKVRNLVWDTLVAAHNLYCELPKDLGTLISRYTQLPYHKFMIKSSHIEDRWEYNAIDAIANLHIMDGEIKELKEAETYEHYVQVTHPLILPIGEMQLEGVNVNEELKERALAREERIQEEIQEALSVALPFPFNPNSPQQKAKLFYDTLGCSKIRYQGTVTTNKAALEKLKNRTPHEYTELLAEACLRYKAASSMGGKLKTPLRKGRIHCAYNAAGTKTGRLDSKESLLGTGTNLQNLSKGIQRHMLIPDPGEEFALVDLWAAEAYLTALDAQEQFLLDMLNRGEKVHNWMLEETTRLFEKEVREAKYDYHKAKQTVHALNYGVKPQKMSMESRLPSRVCEWQHNYYHSKFPGIEMRQNRIKNQLRGSRCLISLLGRKRIFFAPINEEVLNQAYAWPSQSAIAEITNIALTKIYYRGLREPFMFPALNTHDGLAIRCKLGNREAVAKAVIEAFDIPMEKSEMKITIPIEIGWAKNFNDIEDVEVMRYQ